LFIKKLAVRVRNQIEATRSQREGLSIFWRSAAQTTLHSSGIPIHSAPIIVTRAAKFHEEGIAIPVPLQWSLCDLPDDALLFYRATGNALLGWSILVPSVKRWPVCEIGADIVSLVSHAAFISIRVVDELAHEQLRAELVGAMLARASLTAIAADVLMWCPSSDIQSANYIKAAGFHQILRIRRSVPWGAVQVTSLHKTTVGRMGLHFAAESRP